MSIDDKRPDVADALRERLGDRVTIALGPGPELAPCGAVVPSSNCQIRSRRTFSTRATPGDSNRDSNTVGLPQSLAAVLGPVEGPTVLVAA